MNSTTKKNLQKKTKNKMKNTQIHKKGKKSVK